MVTGQDWDSNRHRSLGPSGLSQLLLKCDCDLFPPPPPHLTRATVNTGKRRYIMLWGEPGHPEPERIRREDARKELRPELWQRKVTLAGRVHAPSVLREPEFPVIHGPEACPTLFVQ